MPRSPIRRFLLVGLLVALGVTGALALTATSEKRRLASAYANAQATLAQLEQERTQLDQELTAARQSVTTQSDSLTALEAELANLQASLQQAQHELSQLEQENMTLSEQLDTLTQENQALEAKLSSLKDLKLAIRAVKEKLRHERWQAWASYWNTRLEAQREQDQEQLAQGNRGFVVRHGVSTVGAASMTKLQVRVLDPQPQ